MGAITKWRNTKDWKDTDQYPHKQTNNGFLNTKNLNNPASKLIFFFQRNFISIESQ